MLVFPQNLAVSETLMESLRDFAKDSAEQELLFPQAIIGTAWSLMNPAT